MKKILRIILASFIVFTTTYAQAQCIIYVKADANGTNNGTSWANAYTYLQDALAFATSGCEIWVAAGTYSPDNGAGLTQHNRNHSFVMKNGVAIYGGFDGTETMLTGRNWRTHPAILSGEIGLPGLQDNSYHIIFNNDNSLDNTAILDGFTITNGSAQDGPNSTVNNSVGGGIFNKNASPIVRNCIISGNFAYLGGGGMVNQNASPEIVNCVFISNMAQFGGAMSNESSSAKIINCSFTRNKAEILNSPLPIPFTGGIYNTNSSITIVNSILWDDDDVEIFDYSGSSTISHSIIEGRPFLTNINLAVNPAFVNAATGNLRLQNNSPAINNGINAANNEVLDLDANPRKIGNIDIGAYESSVNCIAGNVLYVNKTATGLNNGSSWLDAFTSLQNALLINCNNITQIWVAAGTYYPDETSGSNTNDRTLSFIMKNNLAIYGGFSGTETQLNERNWKINKTILSGDIDQNDQPGFVNNNNNSQHVVFNYQNELNSSAILNGFIVSGGNSPAGNLGAPVGGGGMANYNSSPSVINCIFTNNAGIIAGGMENHESSPIINNCIFTGNKADVSETSGAMLNVQSSAKIINCSFSKNFGAMTNFLSTPEIINSIFWDNGVEISNSSSTVSVTHSIVQQADGVYPGTGNLNADPLFTDAANGILTLQANSPATDAGSDFSNNELFDLDHNPRKARVIDMGAYESTFECSLQWVLDKDNDDYYTGEPVVACIWPGEGYTLKGNKESGDCNDDDPAVNPETIWYKDTDNDGYSNGATQTECERPSGYKLATELLGLYPAFWDCNDLNAAIHLGALEALDGEDNDCDGAIDEDLLPTSLTSSTSGFQDYIIPVGVSSVNLTVQGAKGGSIKRQTVSGGIPQGPLSTLATGGSGAKLNAKFKVETECQQGLKPGGKLRLIIGATPDAIIRINQIPNPPLGPLPVSSGQGGGGGTAILYQAPGTTGWIVLAVAGGGGGAFSRTDGLNSLNTPGVAAIQQSFAATTGLNGLGGEGFFIQQEIPDGNPRDGGQIITINISGGGGGSFGDAIQNCGGKKGMEEGGTSTLCSNGNIGGYGFGAGGSGISRLNSLTPPDNEEGGGGGGGGYSGGNGGENATGGFGGGSFISDLAFESTWLTSSTADGGSIAITTDPIDNSACCDPEALAFTGSYADVNLGCNPANPDGSLGIATATDATGAATITSTDGPVVSDGCNRSRTRTFTATDGCLNTSTTSRTVRWIADVTPPSFTGSYADVNLGCNPANPDGSLGTAAATDVCGAVTITSSDGAVVSTGCNRSRTRTFTATDGCLNTSTTFRTVRWIADLTPPAFTGSYADVNLGCNPANPDGSLGTATATDICGTVTISSSDGAVQSNGCNRSRTRTFTATDGCLNTSTTSRTVRWIADLTPAAFTGSYADVNLGCNPANPDGALGTATATDVCGAVTITSSDGAVVIDGCNRSRTRTFTATDGCLNTSTTSRTVKWIFDDTPPEFTGSYADVNLGCNPAYPEGALGTATATDACGEVTIISTGLGTIYEGCNRSISRRFIARDKCGNQSFITRTVRWIVELSPPTFTGSYADVNLGCNPATPDGSLGTATATDVCGAVTITSSDGAVVSDGCNRSRTRTFTATDGCLNASTISRTVKWIADLTPPAFTGNNYADVNLGCNPSYPNGSLGTATATDVCGAVTITSSDGAVVSNGCNRSRTRTFTATDGCLNTSTTSRTVRWTADLTPPVFTGTYPDVNLSCNPGNPDGSLGTATATDVCGAVTITSSDGAVASNGCNRSRTRTFTATDGCLNTSTTSRTVRWIYDVTPPTLTCAKTGTVTKSTNAGLCTYEVDGIEFNPTASDVCSTTSLAWSVSGATATDGSGSMNGTQLNFGNNTIKWTATDGCGNTSSCSFIVNVNKVTTTTSLVVSTTPATNPVKQQYSDKVTYTASVTPFNCPGAGFIGGTVTFKIGSLVMGTAPVASDGTATLSDDPLLESLLDANSPTNGPLKPGAKVVSASYSDIDPDYIAPTATDDLEISCEDADITYNGLNYFGANPNTKEGTITVSAFVLDANDVPAQARGDIRNATVTFKEGSSVGTAIGTANIPVGLVNPANYQEGIVTTNKTYTLTTQEISYGGKIVDVWAGVNNYYCGEVAEVVPVCISLPGGDFVTGGGWIKMLNSEGSYAGTDDKKMHAALVFKWNKSNKNLQGNATIVYKRIVNGVQKVYQIKSNSITSMIVNNVNDAGTAVTTGATYRMAQIVTKANFRDLTDPDFPIALFGNLTLTITAWESIATTDGSKDRISVQLVGSGSQGLVFSSNWLSGATQWQQLNSGKMRVRNPSAEIPCTNCSGSGITAKTGEVDKASETIPVTDDLKVTVMPNPSSTNFRIVVNSNDLKEPVKLFVTDMLGRVIETRITNAGQPVTIGDKYISGTYAVRILQGRKSKQLTLIKLSD